MSDNARSNLVLGGFALAIFTLLAGGGCGVSRTDALKPVVNTSLADRGYGSHAIPVGRVNQFAKQSGGDWNRLSPMGKKYMLEDVTDGDVNAAKTMLANAAGHPLTAPAQP